MIYLFLFSFILSEEKRHLWELLLQVLTFTGFITGFIACSYSVLGITKCLWYRCLLHSAGTSGGGGGTLSTCLFPPWCQKCPSFCNQFFLQYLRVLDPFYVLIWDIMLNCEGTFQHSEVCLYLCSWCSTKTDMRHKKKKMAKIKPSFIPTLKNIQKEGLLLDHWDPVG